MLGDEAYLSSSYKSLCNGSTKLRVCHLGIGSVDTLLGYPDSKFREMGTTMHCLRPTVANQYSPSSSASEGNHVYIEGKLTPDKINQHQLIATTIVTAFIEHNRHPDLHALIPIIMVSVPKAVICLYDCTKDTLLKSEHFDWLYTALVRSQLTYCTPIRCPYLVQDINKLEQVQHRATKFILNDYLSDHRSRLLHLNLLPLMYIFECFDIMFLVKSQISI